MATQASNKHNKAPAPANTAPDDVDFEDLFEAGGEDIESKLSKKELSDAERATKEAYVTRLRDEAIRRSNPETGEIISVMGMDEFGNVTVASEIPGSDTQEKTLAFGDFEDYDNIVWDEVPIARHGLRKKVDQFKMPLGQDTASLEKLEKMALDLQTDDTDFDEKLDKIAQANAGRGDETGIEDIDHYLRSLREVARSKADGGDIPEEVKAYLAMDLDEGRAALAKETYKKINSPSMLGLRLPKNKKALEAAQERYDESLRTSSSLELVGLEGDEKREAATELAVDEMLALRNMIDEQNQPPEAKTRFQKIRAGIERVSKFEISKKRHITVGHVATLIAGGAVGWVARRGAKSALGATGAIAHVAGGVIGVAAGAVGGAAAGGAIAGYRAHRDTKSGLLDTTDKETLKSQISQDGEVDETVRSYLSPEADKARKERLRKIRKSMGKGALKGAIAGAGGAVIGVGASEAVEWGSKYLPEFFEGTRGSNDGGIVGNVAPDNLGESGSEGGVADATGGEDTSEYEYGSHDEENSALDATGEEGSAETESQSPTVEDLLQQYEENPVTIESGEGPYATFEKLGIPESQWEDLYNNPEIKAELIEKGLAYETSDGGWGWSQTGELAADDVKGLFEAWNPSEVADVTEVAEGQYADLDPELQEFVGDHEVLTNIPNGYGGEQLMGDLVGDGQAWYAMEDKLLAEAPNDFYRMPDGHVGLAHPGAMSPDGIKALADAMSQQGYALAS